MEIFCDALTCCSHVCVSLMYAASLLPSLDDIRHWIGVPFDSFDILLLYTRVTSHILETPAKADLRLWLSLLSRLVLRTSHTEGLILWERVRRPKTVEILLQRGFNSLWEDGLHKLQSRPCSFQTPNVRLH